MYDQNNTQIYPPHTTVTPLIPINRIVALENTRVIGVGTHKITVSAVAPSDPVEGDIWIDIS